MGRRGCWRHPGQYEGKATDMDNNRLDRSHEATNGGLRPGFTPLGVWAFSIGTSIGWGSFIVTCNTYLLKSGILGTIIGLLVGMARYQDEPDIEVVFEQADKKMYEHKAILKA